MCFGCCDEFFTFFGGFLYVLERLATCLAITSTVSCVVMTIIIMFGLGVGVGYNYCFVDTTLPKLPTNLPPPPPKNMSRSFRKANANEGVRRAIHTKQRVRKRTTTELPLVTENKAFSQIDPFKPFPRRERRSRDFGVQVRDPHDSSSSSTRKYNKDAQTTTERVLVVPIRKFGLISLIEQLIQNNQNVTLKLIASQ